MKAAYILAVAGAAVAQNLSGEPACATSCLVSAISAAGCGPSDLSCQCGPTQAAIATAALPCLLQACTNPADLGIAASVGSAFCVSFSATATMTSMSSGPTTTTTAASTTTTVASTSTAAPTVVTTRNSTVTSHKPTSTSTTSSQSTNAAATPVALGVGAVAAFLGVVAAL